MKYKAIKQIKGERIIVKLIDTMDEVKSESGLIIAKTNEKTKHNTVLVEVVDSKVKELSPGTLVLCSQRAGTYLTDDLIILNTDDVLCEVER